MDKETIKKLAGDERFITGIYNYCDSWCERCSFTSRCLSYAATEREKLSAEEKDFNNDDFWIKMGEIFELTRDIIQDSAEEMGIDLNMLEPEDVNNEIKCFEKACEHELAKMSGDYTSKAKFWLANIDNLLQDKEHEFINGVSLGIEIEKIENDALTLKDATDVIMFYLFFIKAKIIRALHGKIEGVPEEIEYMPKDWDGSAKIALIAIERSISAWSVMLQIFPGEEDFILSMLVHLKRLHANLKKEFPDAMAFVRPGFDE